MFTDYQTYPNLIELQIRVYLINFQIRSKTIRHNQCTIVYHMRVYVYADYIILSYIV